VSGHGVAGRMRTVGTLVVPPRDAAPSIALKRPGSRNTFSWQYIEDPSVHGTLQFMRVAWLAIGRVRAGAHRVVHDAHRLGSPAGSDLHVILQIGGTSVLEQTGHAVILEPGRWIVPAADVAYTIASRERVERLVIMLSRERLASTVKPAQRVGRAFSAASGTGRLFFSTAVCLADELPYIQAANAQALAEQLLALLHIALRHELSRGMLQEKDARRELVHRYITRHLRDPQLSVERIALDLGWSRRTLARVFEAHGETLMEYVYHERLEGIRRDLLNPTLDSHALPEIARSWGFRNYTHFSDRFRSHFGFSPTAVRRRAKAAHDKLGGSQV
jgi:AraC-like DNA-binding protein